MWAVPWVICFLLEATDDDTRLPFGTPIFVFTNSVIFARIWMLMNVLHSYIWYAKNVLHLSISAWVGFPSKRDEIYLMKISTLNICLLRSLKTNSVVGPSELSSHTRKSISIPSENLIDIIIIIILDHYFLCEGWGDTRRGSTLTSRYVDTYQPTCPTNLVVGTVQATNSGWIQFQVIAYQWDNRDKASLVRGNTGPGTYFWRASSRSRSKFP